MEDTLSLVKEKKKRNLKVKRDKKIKADLKKETQSPTAKTDLNDLLDFDMMAAKGAEAAVV